jgi:hypothetical protein
MKKVVFISILALAVCYLAFYTPSNNDPVAGNQAVSAGTGGSIFGFWDDDNSTGGGGASLPSHYFTNTFLDYTFIIRLKNYKAMEDDNLSEY